MYSNLRLGTATDGVYRLKTLLNAQLIAKYNCVIPAYLFNRTPLLYFTSSGC